MTLLLQMRPMPAPRPRVTRWGTYNNPKYTAYKKAIGTIAKSKVQHTEKPLSVDLFFQFKIPKSWSKKKKAGAENEIPRGDCDNLAKGILDALEGLAFQNDVQVKKLSVEKKYGVSDEIGIKIETIEDVNLWNLKK